MVAHNCNLSTQEAEARRSKSLRPSEEHKEFKARMSYIVTLSQNEKNKTEKAQELALWWHMPYHPSYSRRALEDHGFRPARQKVKPHFDKYAGYCLASVRP
jgi:hypothetical protein